jgi:hypothetical protein
MWASNKRPESGEESGTDKSTDAHPSTSAPLNRAQYSTVERSNQGETTMTNKRSLARAQDILRSTGVRSRAALGEDGIDEELLGCSLAEHREWLRSAPASELRSWAVEWMPGCR